jgi:hypothetical protein
MASGVAAVSGLGDWANVGAAAGRAARARVVAMSSEGRVPNLLEKV